MTRCKRGRRRYATRLPVMLSIASVLAFTAETAEITALVSKHKEINSNQYIPTSTRFDTDSFTIGIDSHASACISNEKDHFKDLRHWSGAQLTGIGSTPIQGIGTLAWTMTDDNGQPQEMLIANSLYVPTISKCLLSPQHFAIQCEGTDTNKTFARTGAHHTTLQYGPSGNTTRTVLHNTRSDVPEMKSAPSCMRYHAYAATIEAQSDIYAYEKYCLPCETEEQTSILRTVSLEDEDVLEILPKPPDSFETEAQRNDVNGNEQQKHFEELIDSDLPLEDEDMIQLTQPHVIEQLQESVDVYASSEKGELLRYHYRFGHLPYNKLKQMAREGIIPKRLAKVDPPKCAACMFGKMAKRAWRTKAKSNKIFVATQPGQCVSVDTMESTVPGFVAQIKGRMTNRRYKYATIFIDHFSDFTHTHLHQENTSEYLIDGKRAFEARCRMYQVKVLHYHCDNGRFADNLFKQSVERTGQTISYCGVNAHFQNGRAEKKIRDIREAARTQLLHAINRWPSAIILNLWPYALRYATDVHNMMLTSSSTLSPLQLFAGVPIDCNIKDFHAFGCPVYALDSKLAVGNTVGPWHPRSRLGINLGFSPRHARTVLLVLSTTTGCVSPQFHVKHDDFFESVSAGAGNKPATTVWQSVAGFRKPTKRGVGTIPAVDMSDPPTPFAIQQQNLQVPRENVEEDPSDAAADALAPSSLPSFQLTPSDDTVPAPPFNEDPAPTPDPTGDDSTIRRSTRSRQPTQRLKESVEMGLMEGFPASATDDDEAYYDALHEDDYTIQDQMCDPIAFMGNKADKDTLYYHQAMAAPDKIQFQEAMIKEFTDHTELQHWVPVLLTTLPFGTKVLDSIWAMKRKRDIVTQAILKWKARLNLHGGQQEHGVHYWETYAPVVNWFSIRLLLSQAIMHNWHTRQVDFVLAYPQAKPECEMFMKLPKGIDIPGYSNKTHALKLLRNLYGGRAASRIWIKYLTTGLTNMGFTQSKVDECVWYKGDIIFTFYVDDGIIWCPRAEGIDEFMRDIQDPKTAGQSFDIEDRGDVSDYLGINFSRQKNGKIMLSQPQLIQQIIDDVGISSNHRTKPTPAASSKLLHRDLLGKSFKGEFDYRSVVGKLNFLEKGSRPDIAYAVHQCARFSTNPKESHAEAIRHIVKYLAGTKDKGIILNPDMDKSFEVYVDASFCGDWKPEAADIDVSTAKSRSGYVVSLQGCPLIWHSKLQTQVALSTTEAEYIALSQSLRDTIPIMNLMQELHDRGFTGASPIPTIHCKAFEDNSGALELAKTPKMRPRTKHINLVYHHFRSFVREGKVTVHHVGTKEQNADTLTKSLDQNLFVRHRKEIMGW